MMIFLGDGYVNLDHVKKLQFTSDGTVANVHFTDGSSETLSCHSSTNWTIADSTVVPANPGFSLLMLSDFAGRGPLELTEEPIIAFRVPRSGFYAAPITIKARSIEIRCNGTGPLSVRTERSVLPKETTLLIPPATLLKCRKDGEKTGQSRRFKGCHLILRTMPFEFCAAVTAPWQLSSNRHGYCNLVERAFDRVHCVVVRSFLVRDWRGGCHGWLLGRPPGRSS
jgi:hypothetical protein